MRMWSSRFVHKLETKLKQTTVLPIVAALLVGIFLPRLSWKQETPLVAPGDMQGLLSALDAHDSQRILELSNTVAQRREASAKDLEQLDSLLHYMHLKADSWSVEPTTEEPAEVSEGVGILDVNTAPSEFGSFDDLVAAVEKLQKEVAELKNRTYSAQPAFASATTSSSSGGSCGTFSSPVVTYSRGPVYSSYSGGSGTYSGGYSGRWMNYDGMSKRDHATIVHGINTNGMSDSQVALEIDLDHDTYGGGHPPAMRSRTVMNTTAYASGDCPDGVCPVNGQRTVVKSTRGGLFGFGIIGRRR